MLISLEGWLSQVPVDHGLGYGSFPFTLALSTGDRDTVVPPSSGCATFSPRRRVWEREAVRRCSVIFDVPGLAGMLV